MQFIKEITEITDIRTMFKDSMVSKTYGCQSDIRKIVGTYQIYPLHLLGEFVAQLKEKASRRVMEEEDFQVRYIVDKDQYLWFAEEGWPGQTIPAHYQMTGQPRETALCLAAGNLVFSSGFEDIIGITHKSGGFRPKFESIQWLLVILLRQNITIPFRDKLLIERTDGDVGRVEEIYSVGTAKLTAWVHDQLATEMQALPVQPIAVKTTDYPSAVTMASSSPTMRVRRSIFSDMTATYASPVPAMLGAVAPSSPAMRVGRSIFSDMTAMHASPVPSMLGAVAPSSPAMRVGRSIFSDMTAMHASPVPAMMGAAAPSSPGVRGESLIGKAVSPKKLKRPLPDNSVQDTDLSPVTVASLLA